MARNNNNPRRRRGNRRRRVNQSSQINGPPQLRTNPIFRHTYRFTSGNGARTPVNDNNILMAAGGMCTVTNTTVRSFFSSFKIRCIDIWTPPAAQGSSATCSVEWAGSFNTPGYEVSDTTISVTTPAHVHAVPPPQSIASFWAVGAGANECYIVAPVGSIIDIALDLILFDDQSNLTQSSETVAAGVLGNVYYLSLDDNSTHYYTPVSLTTTI